MKMKTKHANKREATKSIKLKSFRKFKEAPK